MNEKPLILIADDDLDFRELVRDYLAEKGFDVVEAGDGRQAIETALQHNPDIILLDIMMPEKNGFDVCKDLKSDERTKSSVIVMLTVKNRLSDKLTAYIAGAQRYLIKSGELSDIDECLRIVMGQKKINQFQLDRDNL